MRGLLLGPTAFPIEFVAQSVVGSRLAGLTSPDLTCSFPQGPNTLRKQLCACQLNTATFREYFGEHVILF